MSYDGGREASEAQPRLQPSCQSLLPPPASVIISVLFELITETHLAAVAVKFEVQCSSGGVTNVNKVQNRHVRRVS